MVQFKISRTDNEADFAENKLTAGEGVTITKVSDGGYETLEFTAASQVTNVVSEDGYEVKVSGSDSEAGFLANKLTAGDNITITTVSSGGIETLQISAVDQIDESLIGAFQDGYTVKISSSDGLADFLSNKIVAGSNITITTVSSGGIETLRLDVDDQINESLIGAFQDGYTVKVTGDDTIPGFLYSKLIAGNNITLTVNNCGGDETLTIDATDADFAGLDDTVSDHYREHSEAIDLIRQALDGYAPDSGFVRETTFQENKNAQWQINQSVLQSLDGYAQNTTITEHYSQLGIAIDLLRQAADAYGAGGTETEHYNQQQQINQSILQSLDAYGVNINEHYRQHSDAINNIRSELDGYNQTITEHYNQQQQVNENILKDLDGYALSAVIGVVEQTFVENKNAQQQINQSILQALDGYAQNFTITEHYSQLSTAIDLLRQAADGYVISATEIEHYNQQGQINQSILQALDGYAQNTTITEHYSQLGIAIDQLRTAADAYGSGSTEIEHYNQQQQINQSILQALDGYATKVIEDQRWIDSSQQLQDLRNAADGYGITIDEHYNQQSQINQSILQALDGYGSFSDAYETSDSSSISTSYDTVADLSMTLTEGKYLLMYSMNALWADIVAVSFSVNTSIFIGDVQLANTERNVSYNSGVTETSMAFAAQTVYNIMGTKLVTVKWKYTGGTSPNITVHMRSLTAVRI